MLKMPFSLSKFFFQVNGLPSATTSEIKGSSERLCASTLLCPLLTVIILSGLSNAFASSSGLKTSEPSSKTTTSQSLEYRPAGTAFAVSSQGHLITAYHAVSGGSDFRVVSSQYPSGIPAILIAGDPQKDLALLKVASQTTPLKIAKWSSVPTGLEVYALGFPQPRLQGNELKITSGLINAMEGPRGASGFFQFSAPVQRGNSGGPVLSPDGLVVGLVQAKLNILVGSTSREIPQNVNFALQSQAIEGFLLQNNVPLSDKSPPIAFSQSKRPHELFGLAQPSVFAVQVAARETTTQSGEPALSDELRATLMALPKDEQARLYGAFKAGFHKFKIVGSEYVLVRAPATSEMTGDVTSAPLEFVLSLSTPREVSEGIKYRSMLVKAQFDCSKETMLVTRQEYKEESFGTGKTVRALQRSESSVASPRPIKSEALKSFFKASVCSAGV
jgi:hypothetical protein